MLWDYPKPKMIFNFSKFKPSIRTTLFVGITAFTQSVMTPPETRAQTPAISVGEAKTQKPEIFLAKPTLTGVDLSAEVTQIQKIIEADLAFTDQFRMVGDSAKDKSDFQGSGAVKLDGSRIAYEFRFKQSGAEKELLARRYLSDRADYKTLAHSIANDILFAITGKKGFFLTKIAFSCDRTGKKEIYTMNFDGSEVRQITKIRSIALGAGWNIDGTKLAFSVFNRHDDNTRNIDLFEYSFSNGNLRLLSNRKGLNSGASYHPNGKQLALTLSYAGNPEIYLLNLDSRKVSQLTRSPGFDVDPSFSPDGSKIAFVSSRAGKPMVYTMSLANPSDVKRITFAGSYNATPNWAPDSKKLVFAGWLEGHFDLFTITADGSKIERLTKNEGNNEDPSFSPDGSMIAFSSNRANKEKAIYVMNVDGTNVKRLTFGLGNCSGAKWSPYLSP
jgi:TolB protein